MTPLFNTHYLNVVQNDLVLIGQVNNSFMIPRFVKGDIFLKINSNEDSAILRSAMALNIITNQKPVLIKNKIFFSGCKVTLRNKNLYTFLFTIFFKVCPNIKQFEGFNVPTNLDIYSFSLTDISLFDEVRSLFSLFDDCNQISCSIKFNFKNKILMRCLGKSLFFVFK